MQHYKYHYKCAQVTKMFQACPHDKTVSVHISAAEALSPLQTVDVAVTRKAIVVELVDSVTGSNTPKCYPETIFQFHLSSKHTSAHERTQMTHEESEDERARAGKGT